MVQVVKQFVEAVSVFESWFLGQNAVVSLKESSGQGKNARNPEIVLGLVPGVECRKMSFPRLCFTTCFLVLFLIASISTYVKVGSSTWSVGI